MTARSFISLHRNCRRFLAATHHAAISNDYSRDMQVLHFTVDGDIYHTLHFSLSWGAGLWIFSGIPNCVQFGGLDRHWCKG